MNAGESVPPASAAVRSGVAGAAAPKVTVLEVDGVTRRFMMRRRDGGEREFTAVDDVSFSVTSGESLGIVGESGSGKTTLARMLVGLDRTTEGRVLVRGMQMPVEPRKKRMQFARDMRIQMVYQDPYSSLDPRQRVAEALGEALGVRNNQTRAEQSVRITELMEGVGLSKAKLTARPRALSGGQRQRVAIARALACSPELLVLDEATSALDVSIQAQILNLLAELREALALTYVFVSHDLAVVRQIADSVIVMREGKIVEAGGTDQILSHPAAEYTQRLIKAVPAVGWKPRRRSGVDRPIEVGGQPSCPPNSSP